jgi:hypothetical protein
MFTFVPEKQSAIFQHQHALAVPQAQDAQRSMRQAHTDTGTDQVTKMDGSG